MKPQLKKLFFLHYPFILYILFYFIAFSIKIVHDSAPFFDWDESIYVQVGKEMVEKLSLIPLWQGQFWLDKPPFVPLFYGIIMKLTPFLAPEISLRIATLTLAIVMLSLLYILYYKVMKETWITTLVIIITSLTPIIVQRSLVPNIDVFLLIGWIGYILWYKNWKVSLGFLGLGVLSKTLVGFYPLVIIAGFYLYEFFTKKIDAKELIKQIKLRTVQVGIVGIWYAIMFALFGKDFWIQHIYETHFKRVSASIESHFGQRTYYIDLMTEQLMKKPLFNYSDPANVKIEFAALLFVFIILMGGALIGFRYLKQKKITNDQLLNSFFLTPWFLFLNLAKTKIFWYSYPYVPQFAFLVVYPLTLLRKQKQLYYAAVIITSAFLLHYYFFQHNVLASQFSTREPHHTMAQFAQNNCKELYVLVESETRTSYKTLNDMKLTITTSRWWGNHPSMVYYFGGKVNFLYSEDELKQALQSFSNDNCLVVNERDQKIHPKISTMKQLQSVKPLIIYKNTQ